MLQAFTPCQANYTAASSFQVNYKEDLAEFQSLLAVNLFQHNLAIIKVAIMFQDFTQCQANNLAASSFQVNYKEDLAEFQSLLAVNLFQHNPAII